MAISVDAGVHNCLDLGIKMIDANGNILTKNYRIVSVDEITKDAARYLGNDVATELKTNGIFDFYVSPSAVFLHAVQCNIRVSPLHTKMLSPGIYRLDRLPIVESNQ